MIFTLLMSFFSLSLDLLAIIIVAKSDKDSGNHHPSPTGAHTTGSPANFVKKTGIRMVRIGMSIIRNKGLPCFPTLSFLMLNNCI